MRQIQKKSKRKLEKYYTKAFKRRKTDFERLNKSWKKQYEPRSYIEQEWYKDLHEKPSTPELTEIIKDLPTRKAAGPSQITYEMLKNLSTKQKKDSIIYFIAVLLQATYPSPGNLATYILYLKIKNGKQN